LGRRRNAYRVLVGNSEGNRQLGRPNSRWEENIKLNFKEIACGGLD
jgi:hypothetical protein